MKFSAFDHELSRFLANFVEFPVEILEQQPSLARRKQCGD
jgi:hypothetical protein